MRYDPSIQVRRMVVERGGKPVYDEAFHAGVNIIRGENSSGKSTILNFIFYGLGGDLTDWSGVALLCNRVLLEVELNGKKATLSREISKERGQAMDIFAGDLASAKAAARDDWVRYPYARSSSKESFSQAIFRLLAFPEVANEVSGNITMHQILRLIYADQLSPVENLFKFDTAFDSPLLRDAIGRLLCGAYDNLLYQNELRIRESQKEFDTVNGELRSLFVVLGRADISSTLEWISGQRLVLEEQRTELQSKIEEAEREVYTAGAHDTLTLKAQDQLYSEVQTLQTQLGTVRNTRDSLAFGIADSDAFIASLRNKLLALNDADSVANQIGEVQFQSCPACYAPLDTSAHAHACHLCKTPFDSERSKARIVALINDTALQLKQSELLQSKRKAEMQKATENVAFLEVQWARAAEKLREAQRLPSTSAREVLRELHRQVGYLERETENLDERARIAELVEQLSQKKSDLNALITKLKTDNEALKLTQEKVLADAYTAIADEIRTLLMNDLRRQDTFENPKSIEFSFASNKISVDGESYFSASSRVILKSSFFLGFLAASTKRPTFRYPRFCLIDTIEDKGMEPARSHNFQLQIARVSAESKVELQIIFATAMIAPDLDEEKYTIGKFSTRDEPTIAIST